MYFLCSENRALISCAVTAQLIASLSFAFAKSRFSHDAAGFILASWSIDTRACRRVSFTRPKSVVFVECSIYLHHIRPPATTPMLQSVF